jgi:rSAM/selenodomain-associated transferase 1
LDDRCLLFFVRNPEGETVKSRLAVTAGKTVALELYKNFIFDMLATLEKRPSPLYCCFYPEDALTDIQRIIGTQYQYLPQKGDDLGARMTHCFRTAFSQDFQRVVLIGSDLPDLPGEIIDEAFGSLEDVDSVIGPTIDGGYYLIGFKKESFTPEIFNGITWSTEIVLQKTLAILKHHKRIVHQLPRWRDIDTLEDLRLFFERNRDTSMSPRTMTYLKDNDILLV